MYGCWAQIPALLRGEEDTFCTRLALAAAEVERSDFTERDWDAAAVAMAAATEAAGTDAERAEAACERAMFCYAQTVFAGVDRAARARQALAEAETLAGEDSPLAPMLAFRRGLITENLDGDNDSARQYYARAHEVAERAGDEYTLAFTIRHFAILDHKAGRIDLARQGFVRSLELREKVGFLIGMAPALSGLARVTDEPEASRLRAESRRWVRALGLATRLAQ